MMSSFVYVRVSVCGFSRFQCEFKALERFLLKIIFNIYGKAFSLTGVCVFVHVFVCVCLCVCVSPV